MISRKFEKTYTFSFLEKENEERLTPNKHKSLINSSMKQNMVQDVSWSNR